MIQSSNPGVYIFRSGKKSQITVFSLFFITDRTEYSFKVLLNVKKTLDAHTRMVYKIGMTLKFLLIDLLLFVHAKHVICKH